MKVKSERGWKLVGFLGRLFLRLIVKTSKVTVLGEEMVNNLRIKKKPIIHVVWHGRIFLAPYFFRHQGIMPLVSPSEDGEIVARIIEGWGYKILRGSSSHSMVSAWKEMVNELKTGGEVLIVPDGPKGPNRFFKAGAIRLASITGAYLVPFSFSASRRRFLGSWDHFLLAWPFSRIVALFGEPFLVPGNLSDEEIEKFRLEAQKRLCELDEEADRLVSN
ncbi:MAG: lysophospholipid acyltransferase family protein [Candidatus Aminicenantes bacterium]|nr:lysophospholipid acyltransferase family protein [Candidatus Aminicenantes bacterium]